MRRFLSAVLLTIMMLSALSVTASAQENGVPFMSPSRQTFTQVLRAGGGGSGGGGGGGGSSGGSSGHHHTSSGNNGYSDPLSEAVGFVCFLLIASASTIAFRLLLSKRARNARRLMRLLQQKDHAWKYKHIQKQVRQTYFVLQRAWTNSDMTPVKECMSDALYQSFQTKLSWMRYRNQRNVLKWIRLLEALPVAVHDEQDDSQDFVWFYIKGRMVDYTVDTETNERLDGSAFPERFCEYWQFMRTQGDRWVLNAILQEDEADQIEFAEE